MTKKDIKEKLSSIVDTLEEIDAYSDNHPNKTVDIELVSMCEHIEDLGSTLCDYFRFLHSNV